jgi:hypothetical protein
MISFKETKNHHRGTENTENSGRLSFSLSSLCLCGSGVFLGKGTL